MSLQAGVEVDDEICKVFEEMKLRSTYAYLEFRISDDMKRIEVVKKEARCSYDDFIKNLPADDCCYCVYDLHLDLGDSGERNKLLFINWCPDSASTKKKMIYASTKGTVKNKLKGIAHEIQANDMGSLKYEDVVDDVKSKAR